MGPVNSCETCVVPVGEIRVDVIREKENSVREAY